MERVKESQTRLNSWNWKLRSSLIYNTSARNERLECNTTATPETQVQYKCYTNNTNVTRVKNFNFANDTGKNIFSHAYIYYMASGRLQQEEQFHTKNYLLEMSCDHAKMRLKSAPQKVNFLMAKDISASCTLDCSCKCPCTFPRSYVQQGSLIFDKNHFMW